MQVIAQGPAVNHGAVLRQLRELRGAEKPAAWRSVQHALDLSDKELRSYRWLSAAQIRAEHPRRPWKAIAADPSVDLRESTLKTNHAAAVLPSGQTWAEYVNAYQQALHARLSALQAAAGVAAAEDFFDGVKMLSEVVSGLVADLKDQRDNPPPAIVTTFDAKGNPIMLDCTEQLVLAFPGLEGEETVQRHRRTLGFNTMLRREAEGLARAQRLVHQLLGGKSGADEAEQTGTPVNREVLVAKRDELSALVDELREYEAAVAA